MKVAIAGGGIAGLAAACACAMRGIDVQVFEQSPELGDIGAGLQISPNGWRVLQALGLSDALSGAAFEPPEIELRLGRSGRRIWRMPMGATARSRWGAPYLLVHRADLIDALAARLHALAPGALVTGRHVTGYADGQLLFAEGVAAADLIVGADGLHSVIRAQMIGPDKPVYTGNVAWRGLVPAADLGEDAPPANVTIWAGQSRHAVTTRVRGGGMVNFVGMIETPDPGEEGWRITGNAADVAPLFDGWAAPIRRILEHATALHRWALFDRAPLPRWSDGAACLIGDAAHPMLPSFAQGAVQGLEDAWVLASELATCTSPGDAARALYAQRIERTARLQHLSAVNAAMFHRAGPLKSPIYYGGMAAVAKLAPSILYKRQDWAYGDDVIARHPLS